MYNKWIQMVQNLKLIKIENTQLEEDKELILKVEELNQDLINKQTLFDHIIKELNKAKAIVEKLSLGTSKLDHVLNIGKPHGDKIGLGYTGDVGTSGSHVGTFVKLGTATVETNKNGLEYTGDVDTLGFHVGTFIKAGFAIAKTSKFILSKVTKFVTILSFLW